MNSWAAEGKYDCHFLCVCVLGDRSAWNLAREFANEMQLTHCVNGFIDNEADLPTYGQLGCKGFIVLDAEHRVISKGTSAFMQVRDLAFEHVEALLDAVCEQKPLPSLCPGEQVNIIEAPHRTLIGSTGVCTALGDGMVKVGLMDGPMRGKLVQLPMTAVRKVGLGNSPSPSPGGGCATGGCSTGGCDKEGSCGTGGAAKCDGSGNCGAEGNCGEAGGGAALDGDFVASSLDLVSVKVPSMDAEHSECAEALRRLATECSGAALQAVIACLSSHFDHEEALFEQFGWGAGANERFSAKKTHIEDHVRILEKLRSQLALLAGPASIVPTGSIREVLQDFHEHTSRYDVQYAEQLSAKGAN
mmetsp:Transcript_55185/g.118593  ORF Transcript_55185/g.118593 Transcript_55185/m.118593 type:complete len:359 (-) Transcript_55185:87-1163(-)